MTKGGMREVGKRGPLVLWDMEALPVVIAGDCHILRGALGRFEGIGFSEEKICGRVDRYWLLVQVGEKRQEGVSSDSIRKCAFNSERLFYFKHKS